jgi:CRP-like cAMP-binding protein
VNLANEPPRNRLLASLSLSDIEQLLPSAEPVALDVRRILEEPRSQITHVYFVESGLVSVVGTARPDQRIEVGMVGYEGMTGLGVILGDDRSANETLVQSAGTALRVPTESMREAMNASSAFSTVLLRYVHVFMVQSSQTALANGRGKLDERLARWLLMWHDRLRTDSLTITHEFLALLLGVRRQGVTVALHTLEGRGLIRSTRGLIRILDRDGLRLAANGFYGIPEDEYDRSIGPSPRAEDRPRVPAPQYGQVDTDA